MTHLQISPYNHTYLANRYFTLFRLHNSAAESVMAFPYMEAVVGTSALSLSFFNTLFFVFTDFYIYTINFKSFSLKKTHSRDLIFD